jgi:hypothetical protein
LHGHGNRKGRLQPNGKLAHTPAMGQERNMEQQVVAKEIAKIRYLRLATVRLQNHFRDITKVIATIMLKSNCRKCSQTRRGDLASPHASESVYVGEHRRTKNTRFF